LTDVTGQTYNYLYWEGTDNINYDFSEGFCIAGKETAAFLENAIDIPNQELAAAPRTGFTVVEWGGCRVE